MDIPAIVSSIIAEIMTIVFVFIVHMITERYKSRLLDTHVNSQHLMIAPIWRRFFAGVIDICLIYVILLLQIVVFSIIKGTHSQDAQLFPYIFFGTWGFIFCYYGYMWTNRYGQTVGKHVMALKIVKKDGKQMKLFDAWLRCLGIMIGSFLFNLGFIWAIFDDNNQCWHDKMAGTYVIKE